MLILLKWQLIFNKINNSNKQQRKNMLSQSHRIIQKILNSQLKDESSIDDFNQNTTKLDQSSHSQSIQMMIELDSKKSAIIKIHAQDDAILLAKQFCFQHSIDPRVITTLTNNIKNVQNIQFPNRNKLHHNISKLSYTTNDKQNNSSYVNRQNDSFNYSKANNQIKNSIKYQNQEKSYSNLRQSVFDRLYRHSKKYNTKQKTQINKLTSNKLQKKTSRQNQKQTQIRKQMQKQIVKDESMSDPCLLIYQKNRKAQLSSIKKRQQQKAHLQAQKISSCTFKPCINPISSQIAYHLPSSYRSQQFKHRQMKRIQNYIQEKQKKLLEQCTFQPRINRSRSKSNDRWKHLYQDSRVRQVRRQDSLDKINTTTNKVKINRISDSIVGDTTFYQRLNQDFQKRQQKKLIIQQKLKQQQKRTPQTGRAPINRSRVISIGEHLYNQAKAKCPTPLSVSKSRLTCNKSQAIYQSSKRSAFQYIFTLLDGNQDGLISNTSISLSRLSEDILKLLTPLLVQMEQIQATLDQNQFLQAFDRLFKGFSVAEKHMVLKVYKSSTIVQQHQPSFQPSLNQKSLNWARQSRPQNVNQYEIWKQTQAVKQQRIEQIKALQILQQLEECTFHPKLFR